MSLYFKSQNVEVRVENSIAVIEITQVYQNELDTAIEAQYEFPIETELKSTVVSNIRF